MKSEHGLNLGYIIFGFLVLFAIQAWVAASGTMLIDYSRFLDLLNDGAVTRVTVTETRIEGDLAQPIDGKSHFVTVARELDIDVRGELASALKQAQSILEQRSGDLRRGAELLLTSETITPNDFPPIARNPSADKSNGPRAIGNRSAPTSHSLTQDIRQ